MAIINKTGIGTGNTIQAEHVTRIIDVLSGGSTDSIAATGSFTGSFTGALDGALTGTATITAGTATLTSIDVTGNGSVTIDGKLIQGNDAAPNIASGLYGHAEGRETTITSDYGHAEGRLTLVTVNYAHAEGYNTTASNFYAHSDGEYTVASGYAAHAEGSYTTASNVYAHSEGRESYASGQGAHAEGYQTEAFGGYSHAEGYQTTAFGQGAHAEGFQTYASGTYSNAKGIRTLSSGRYSLAIGNLTTASADQSFAAGFSTIASANGAHAQGQYTTASAGYSHAEGAFTEANGAYSHAEGDNTITFGAYSHAEGRGTIASGSAQHVSGRYNTHGDNSSMFIIGDGASDAERSDVFKAKTNAIEVSGSLNITGSITVRQQGAPFTPSGLIDIRGGYPGDLGRSILITSGSGVGPDTEYGGVIITTLTSSHNQHINLIKAGIHPHSLGYVSGTNRFMIAISTGSDADDRWSAETGRGGFVQDLYRHGFNTNAPSHSIHVDKTLGISGNTTYSYTDIAQNVYWNTNWTSTLGGPGSLLKIYGGPTDDAGFNFYTSTEALSLASGSTVTFTSKMFISASGRIGINTETPTSRLDINATNGYEQLRLRTSYTPTGTADTVGNTGDIAWDASYIYVKTAAGWKRSALGTW